MGRTPVHVSAPDSIHGHGPAWHSKPPSRVPVCGGVSDGYNDQQQKYNYCCANNPHYIDYSLRIAGEMAKKFASHPAVIGWQIDNEYGNQSFGDDDRK